MNFTLQKKSHILFGLILFLTISLLSYIISSIYTFLNTPLIPPQQNINYIFSGHSTVKTLATDLNQIGVLQHPNYLIALAYINGTALHLHAGEYIFKGGSTAPQILMQIAQRKVVVREITFIEGCTIWQVLNALNQAPRLRHELKGITTDQLMSQLGLPAQSPEGQFFPNTYFYSYGSSDKAILLHAYNLMQKHLLSEWQQRAANLPYTTPYDALITASIIEKEAKLNQERPIIAGVIVRRLQQKMYLDMDATIIYGLGENFVGPLTKNDLRQDTPFNTYIHLGLPPTAIAMPSLASINAALHPQAGNVMYYVAKNDGSGSHQFSVTYQQQQQAIAQYEGKNKSPSSKINN